MGKSMKAVVVSIAFLFGTVSSHAQTGEGLMRPKEMPLKLDKDLGVPALRIGEGKLHQVDVTLVEIPPGAKLAPHKHLAEEMVLIISGKGYTMMWNGQEPNQKQRYDWSEGDLLSPSLNS